MDNGLFIIALIFMVLIFVGTLYLILTEPKRKRHYNMQIKDLSQ